MPTNFPGNIFPGQLVGTIKDIMNTDFLTMDVPSLYPFLETILQDGGKRRYTIDADIKAFRNLFGYSGFTYESGETRAQLSVGLILGDTGYVLRRIVKDGGEDFERNDYFDLDGNHTFTSETEALKVLIPDSLEMDLSCPVLDLFYNYLHAEYKRAGDGKCSTQLVHSVEKMLRKLYASKRITLPIKNGAEDLASTNVFNRMLRTEMDPVLNWEERQILFRNQLANLNDIMSTKNRAHRTSLVLLKLGLLRKRLSYLGKRFAARPADNTKGFLYRYTVGKVIWFFQTVKNNLGYSVALAVYGPFTYYFITMPMNPHAMQAVGRVRATYLEAKHTVMDLIDKGELAAHQMQSRPAIAAAPATTTTTDSVTTTAAAPAVTTKVDPSILANIIYESSVTTKNEPVMLTMGEGKKESATPTLLNMLVSSDVPAVNSQNWPERMSSMKQMQIAYEENIEYASRMGRLEQLETQYNFPMQVEQTWEELERYNNMIFKLRTENPGMSAKMKQYLFNEVNRTQQLQVYLWDRLGRFILDQVYVMLDQDKEQKRSDYYVGRSFVLMNEMTQTLSWRYKNLKKPQDFERIEKLAEFYKLNRKELGSVLKNLAANSDLFKQKDLFSTAEFRGHMKRQWEILFLQNAKAEEASNMGLNMYIWSVRNTVWVLQSIFATKRDELALLIKRDLTGQLFTPEEMLVRSKANMQYETLFHNLVLEYVGIREEIMNRLGKDIESAQRKVVIENLKEFLSDRDKLDGLAVSAQNQNGNNKTGTTL